MQVVRLGLHHLLLRRLVLHPVLCHLASVLEDHEGKTTHIYRNPISFTLPCIAIKYLCLLILHIEAKKNQHFHLQAIVKHDKERISQRKAAKRRKRESMRINNKDEDEEGGGTGRRGKRKRKFLRRIKLGAGLKGMISSTLEEEEEEEEDNEEEEGGEDGRVSEIINKTFLATL